MRSSGIQVAPGKARKSKLPPPETYRLELQNLIRTGKQLDKLASKAAKAKAKSKGTKKAASTSPRSQEQSQALGKFDTKTVQRLKTLNYEKIKKFGTPYTKAYQLVPEDRVGSANSAFTSPVLVRAPLINFFRNVDLGVVPGTNARVQELLPFLVQGQIPLGSRSILASLLSLYAKKNRLYQFAVENRGKASEEQMNRQVLGADPQMNQFLGPLFDRLETMSRNSGVVDWSPKPQTGKRVRKYNRPDGSRIWNDHNHVFARDNFSYSAFQSLFSAGGVVDRKTFNASPAATAAIQAEFGLPAGFNLDQFRIPPEVGRKYMQEVTVLKDQAKVSKQPLSDPENTFIAIATRAAAPLAPQQVPGLSERARLDTIHSLVSVASHFYDQPKTKTRKPRKQATA